MLTVSNRNGNVEFLRCLAIYLIIQLHCGACEFSPFFGGAVPGFWSAYFAFTIWHVDAFISISGWYGIHFKWSKVLRLVGVFLFYLILRLILIICVLKQDIVMSDLFVPCGWFGESYMMLMFVAPLLNSACCLMCDVSPRRLFSVWVLFAIAITLSWFPPTSAILGVRPAGGGGLSVVTMIFVYVTARVAKLLKFRPSVGILCWVGMYFVGSIAVWGTTVSVFRYLNGLPVWGYNVRWLSDFNAPHVWLIAVAIVYLFAERIRLPDWLCKISCFCSPSVLAIYLLHQCVHTKLSEFIIGEPARFLLDNTVIPPLAIVFLVSGFAFISCLAVDVGRRMLLMPFRSILDRIFNFVDARFLPNGKDL